LAAHEYGLFQVSVGKVPPTTEKYLWQAAFFSRIIHRSMNVRVKICGTTSLDDAFLSVEAGADALGFVFYPPSPRHILPATAAEIIRKLPPFIAKVGVFVNAPADEVKRAIEHCGLDTLQFHGDEPPAFCRQFGLKVLKAFRIRDEESLRQMTPYHEETWLLDTYVPGKVGGTGEPFKWALARQATNSGRPVILAGGLTPENVERALREGHPYGIDVASGVELAPGQKDPQKVREFIRAARRTAAGICPPPA
jgi:phosphoribosylanthranilate isomerase